MNIQYWQSCGPIMQILVKMGRGMINVSVIGTFY